MPIIINNNNTQKNNVAIMNVASMYTVQQPFNQSINHINLFCAQLERLHITNNTEIQHQEMAKMTMRSSMSATTCTKWKYDEKF